MAVTAALFPRTLLSSKTLSQVASPAGLAADATALYWANLKAVAGEVAGRGWKMHGKGGGFWISGWENLSNMDDCSPQSSDFPIDFPIDNCVWMI